MTNAIITVQGGPVALPTLLGQGAARIPTGGKIRPGIMVLTKKAAEVPGAKEIYQQGVADGHSFEQIERALKDALPQLKVPLVPRNVPWFTVRAQDFPNPEVARQILRHELSVNPNVVLPVVREGLQLLSDDSKSAVVRLNPLDMDVLQDTLQTEFASLSLTLTPDSSIAPGGCRISSAGAVVDGDLHLRWRRAVAKLGLDLD